MIGNCFLDDEDLVSAPPGSSDKPVSLAVTIYGIVSLFLYVLVALDDGAGSVVLVIIGNPGSFIVVVSYP